MVLLKMEYDKGPHNSVIFCFVFIIFWARIIFVFVLLCFVRMENFNFPFQIENKRKEKEKSTREKKMFPVKQTQQQR